MCVMQQNIKLSLFFFDFMLYLSNQNICHIAVFILDVFTVFLILLNPGFFYIRT